MNMLDVEDDSFHVTSEGYSNLSDSEWEVVGRMSVLMGEPAISGMLTSLSRDQQRAAINKFLQGELAVERQKLACYSSKALISQWVGRRTRVDPKP
uniref:Uncharacterized protein n=1 Tax=Peronospora matthiolae TaxID=2874970 RepID=A0AAV1VKT0_9STRA